MLKRSYFKTLIFLFLLLVLCVSSLESVNASSNTKKNQVFLQDTSLSSCSNLDVIFIIDQSSSMSGDNGTANDPTKQRKNAVDGMIDLLVDLSIDQCPGSYHRIGVISFGDEGKTRVDLPLSDISPRSPIEAQDLRENLKAMVLADNLGQTYPQKAFETAWDMLEFSPSAGGNEPRKKVILFVTDGFPCVPGGSCDPNKYEISTELLRDLVDSRFDFADALKRREMCLAQLRITYGDNEIPAEESTGCLEANPVNDADYKNSTYIYTILLRNSGQSIPTLAQDVLSQMSQDYAGQLISLRRNAEDIPTTLRQILSQLAGVRPNLLDCGGFAVNPYLKKAIVTAYKTVPEVQVTLSYTDANNEIHTIQGGGPDDGFTVIRKAVIMLLGQMNVMSSLLHIQVSGN
ncbi:MAG: VWA domain-containing protein [Anaerolineales bacterium]|nr:VWA domain-containing protein [Anaerolineales bacterium]